MAVGFSIQDGRPPLVPHLLLAPDSQGATGIIPEGRYDRGILNDEQPIQSAKALANGGLTVHPNLLELSSPDFEPVPVPALASAPVVRLRPNGEGSGDDLAGLGLRSRHRLRNVAFTVRG